MPGLMVLNVDVPKEPQKQYVDHCNARHAGPCMRLEKIVAQEMRRTCSRI